MAVLLFLVIFLLFAIKKEYIGILVGLVIMLIIDFAVVKGLANTPLFGTIAISVGQPFLSILIYVIIKLIVMGIFFWLLQKNYITAFVGYLIINIFIYAFYMTISDNIFLDTVFNVTIAGIILLGYNKLNFLDDLKWFSISAMITDFVLQILISSLFFK